LGRLRNITKAVSAALRRRRSVVQGITALLSNIHITNLFKGTLYTGTAKNICVPGLNCYSCPAASAACPVGAFQAAAGSAKHSFSYYAAGTAMLFGVLTGRLICGFFCPFGWFQDLLHMIPGKKFSTKKFKALKYLKYVVLIVFVVLLSIFLTDETGRGSPYFCKYICPQGILEAGIPLAIVNPAIRNTLGVLFTWKSLLLTTVTVLSVFFYRPFCKYICPLGAFYAFFNKISLYKYHVDSDKCIHCGKCESVCGMDVDISKCQDALECIRCGKCIDSCPVQAIHTSLSCIKRVSHPIRAGECSDTANISKNRR